MREWPLDTHAQRDLIISAEQLKSARNANNIFEDLYDYLIEEEGQSEHSTKRCPEVYICIESIEVKALVDTGSQVTGISQDWYLRNKKELICCEKLPVVNYKIIGATGGTPVKVNEQIFAEVTIDRLKDRNCFFVIPRLKHDIVLGY